MRPPKMLRWNPRFFLCVVPVLNAMGEATNRTLRIEVEVDSSKLDTPQQEIRRAVLDAADQYTRKHFDNENEHLGTCEMFEITMHAKRWEKPGATEIDGVRIWGVALQVMTPPAKR
jgi:hypothetical protein